MADTKTAPASGAGPTTDDKIGALADSVAKLARRFDSFTSTYLSTRSRKDDAVPPQFRKERRKDDDDDRRDRRDANEGSKDRPAKPPYRADAEEEDDGEGKGDRKDAKRRDKDFEDWAEEEEKEPNHKDARRAKKDEDDDDAKKDDDDDDDRRDAKKDDEDEDEDDKDRKDAKRKDDDEEESGKGDPEGKGEPEPMASDDDRRRDRRAKKDDDDDKRRDRRDRRKDDDDDDDDDRRRDSRSDSALARRIEALERNRARPLSDADLDQIAELQHSWAEVSQAHGERAARPMDGEPVHQYDRRMARRFQKHSTRWSKENLRDLPVSVQRMAAAEIRADAITAAYRGDAVAKLQGLREIKKQDATGRTISEFVGSVEATLAPFKIPALRVKAINTDPNRW